MEPIPTPHVLDPDRVLDNDRGGFTVDHEARAALYEKGFRQSNAYAQQLWNALAVARTYLWDSLPSDPRSPGAHPRASAAPTGPDDDEGWRYWVDTYAGVTSVLCGPHGDSGFGAGEAREAARFRRDAPDVGVAARVGASAGDNAASPARQTDSDSSAAATDRAPGAASPASRPNPGLRMLAVVTASVAVGRYLIPRRARTVLRGSTWTAHAR